jgi:hypothetical protein
MKNILKVSLGGIATAWAVFTIIGVIMDISNGGTLIEPAYAYSKMAIGAMIVGLGFSIPSIIYDSERLSMVIKVIVHMSIGCTIMLITAFVVGWIPQGIGFGTCLIIIGSEIIIAFVIWLFYWRYYKKLAKQMNEHIAEKQKS